MQRHLETKIEVCARKMCNELIYTLLLQQYTYNNTIFKTSYTCHNDFYHVFKKIISFSKFRQKTIHYCVHNPGRALIQYYSYRPARTTCYPSTNKTCKICLLRLVLREKGLVQQIWEVVILVSMHFLHKLNRNRDLNLQYNGKFSVSIRS